MVVNYMPGEATIVPDAYRAKCSQRVRSAVEFCRSPEFTVHLLVTFSPRDVWGFICSFADGPNNGKFAMRI